MKLVDNWWVPDEDQLCLPAIREDAMRLNEVVCHCLGRSLAVQAGGNVGVYPIHLANWFRQVITFEPAPANFKCLQKNLSQRPSVFAFPLALGAESKTIHLANPEAINAGTWRVEPQGTPAQQIPLDSWHLPFLDLLMLDIEGYELEAIKGAMKTIARCRPVIALEIKDHCRRYQTTEAKLAEFLGGLGYRVQETIKDDVVFTPLDSP